MTVSYAYLGPDPSASAVKSTGDGGDRFIPADPANADYARFLKHRAAGGVVGAYAPPAVDLLGYAADRRWQIETGGITVGGIPVATDDRSKLMLLGARVQAEAGLGQRWKGADGQFIDLPAASVIAFADAVAAHVRTCFEAEEVVAAAITAGALTTTADIDAAFADVPTVY